MPDTPETRSTSHFARFWSLWISCGSCVGRFVVFGHVWFFGSGLRIRSCSCDFCGSVVLLSMPMIARSFCGFARKLDASFPQVSRLDADDCALILRICPQVRRKFPASFPPRCTSACPWSLWSLWTAKKICPLPHFVLCSVSSPLEATITNGENDHG